MRVEKADAKHLIKANLCEMLKEKPLDKISVSTLCKKAGVSRSTFYSHYEDKYKVLEDIVYEDFAAKIEQAYSVLASTHSEIIGDPSARLMAEIMFQSIYDKRDFYLALAQRGRAKPLARALANASKRLRLSVSSVDEGAEDEKCRYASIHGVSSMTSIVIEWLRGGATTPPKQLAEWVSEWNHASNKPGFDPVE